MLDWLGAYIGDGRGDPLVTPWPVPGDPAHIHSFSTLDEWKAAVGSLDLKTSPPEIVAAKFRRALKLYFLGWIDADLPKAGELVALTTLELALRDRYGAKVRKPNGRILFPDLLKYTVTSDGLTDARIPMVRRCGGTAIGFVTGEARPSLADRRNAAAHGDPFDGLPCGGLLELVRDLIDYAYRDWVKA